MRGSSSPPAKLTLTGPRPVNTRRMTMTKQKKWNCEECTHSMQETTDDVACCNCCEDGEFFEEYRDEYTLADLGPNWW